MRIREENQLEVVEVLRISELPGQAFAEVKTAEGEVQWEEISPKEAHQEKRRLKQYRVIKKKLRRALAPAVQPVIRIGADGVVGFGSSLTYKGIGPDGHPEYWHIPTATILVEDVGYAARQIAATLLMLKARRDLI